MTLGLPISHHFFSPTQCSDGKTLGQTSLLRPLRSVFSAHSEVCKLRPMNRRFLIMLLIGLGLMIALWIKQSSFDRELAERAVAVTGCQTDPSVCAEHQRICQDAPSVDNGVCTYECSTPKDCPDTWCCRKAPSGDTTRSVCLPAVACRETP